MDMLMETIETLKLKAEEIPEPEDIVERARIRRSLGKLPYPTEITDGLGDGIAWELLLSISDLEKTIIVTEDWGWKNKKDGNANSLHPSMIREWKSGNRGEIKLYNALSSFIKTEFPEVKISKKEIELDKKPSYYNPSIYPVTYPVTYGVPYQIGDVDRNDVIDIKTGKGAASKSLSINGSTVCTKCFFILTDNSGAIVPSRNIICPNCGEVNFV
jgi:hypothetical protein